MGVNMSVPFDPTIIYWKDPKRLDNRSFVCGYCGDKVSSDKGYMTGEASDGSGNQTGGVYICSNCHAPTFFSPDDYKFPNSPFGNSISNLPDGLNSIYEEARKCTSQNCYTASVMLCRKILMNIAVDKGADKDLSFLKYVNYLSDEGYIPPDGKQWVDHIRKRGNEANHEINLMDEKDAKELIIFSEMLLRFIYEFPSIIPSKSNG